GVGPARPRPVLEAREAAKLPRETRSVLHGPLGPLPRRWDLETRRPERCAKRPERLPVEGLRGHGAPAADEIRPRRGPPQLGEELVVGIARRPRHTACRKG